MNSNREQTREQDDTLLSLVDFKWLMAGLGWWVNLTRMQRDTAYAREWLRRGLSSGSRLVRQRSAELLPRLTRLGAQGHAAIPCVSSGTAR